ncbi:DUF1707 SHOCT-like domain-containing protein [Propionicicella superfundia]|uniref:DUF1707 SHOCT-like domain-containing protein n=1 Tax=Propionicicella superfundia TaxID=348582 RepID=UPI00041BC127|nr:DUF1707 domain-containing protein [Propionicicella superfundia]
MTERDDLRVGHAERDAAVADLREAHAAGRITVAELDERTAAARQARTVGDLAAVLADLRLPDTPAPLQVRGPEIVDPGFHPSDPLVLRAGFTSVKRRDRWVVPPYIRAHAVVDDILLDCLFATAESPVVDLEILPGAGTVTLILPDGWAVNADRLSGGMGSVRLKVASEPSWGSPLFLVRGTLGLGDFKARGANRWDKRRYRLDR